MITKKEIAITRTKKGMSLKCLKFAYSILAEIEHNSYHNSYYMKKLYFNTIESNFQDEGDKRRFIDLFDLLGYLSAETDEYLLLNIQ